MSPMIPLPHISGIYKILCAPNGKIYIGSGQDIYRRCTDHWAALIALRHDNPHLQNAFNAYGPDAFSFMVLELCPVDQLLTREQFYLDTLRPYDHAIGFNISLFAGAPMRGRKHTAESLAKKALSAKTVPLADRFWACVRQNDDPSACWPWMGARTNGGYGVIRAATKDGGKIIRAARLSWVPHNGSLSDDLDILHSCDNPPCVNPGHLSPGTAKENVADMIAKGRMRKTSLCDEKHHQSKFTNEQIIELRSDYAAGVIGIRALARKYDVDKKAIQQIVRRLTWTHI